MSPRCRHLSQLSNEVSADNGIIGARVYQSCYWVVVDKNGDVSRYTFVVDGIRLRKGVGGCR